MRTLSNKLAFVFLAVALVACGERGLIAPQGGTPVSSDAPRPPDYEQAHLYVAICCAVLSSIYVYSHDGTSLARKISRGVSNPRALAFDGAGNLYAANELNSVTEFAAGGGSIVHVFRRYVHSPVSLAIDAANELYVSNEAGGRFLGSVSVYSSANGFLYHITKGVYHPNSIALDTNGNLYVANGNRSTVTVYSPRSTMPMRVIRDGIDIPAALAFDNAGNLYVANTGITNSVTVYAPNGLSPLRTITQGLDEPLSLALDGVGNLFVRNISGDVVVYSAGSSLPVREIHSSGYGAGAITVDKSGYLYTGSQEINSNYVNVYAPGSTSPQKTIRLGSREPAALALGP